MYPDKKNRTVQNSNNEFQIILFNWLKYGEDSSFYKNIGMIIYI